MADARTIARNFGAHGERWLAALPAQIAELERAWSIEQIAELDIAGECAWIGVVRRHDGSDAILKITVPHVEARHEGDALRAWAGDAAVHLIAGSDDGFALLLERCLPGDTLWGLSAEAGNAIACAVGKRLWRPVPPGAPFVRLSDVVARWRGQIPAEAPGLGYSRCMIDAARQLCATLMVDPPAPRLLHGDLHPGNILAARREPWLAIDPKPVVGDPAYDWAQMLCNRCEAALALADPCTELVRQVHQLADSCEHDPQRVAAWAFVKALGWDIGPSRAALLFDVWEALR
jgi:streptomycin 6-kinase